VPASLARVRGFVVVDGLISGCYTATMVARKHIGINPLAPISEVADQMARRVLWQRKRWLDAGDMVVMIRCAQPDDPKLWQALAKRMVESLNEHDRD
jgi:hypothetical protein